MKYCFYSKNDSKKEPIDKIEAENSKKALTYFSKLKNLPQKLFLQIYKITNEKVL